MATQTSAIVSAPSTKLEDQATTAALYVTKPAQNNSLDAKSYLDSDYRLSSAGAAASLKYASPRDLPSFPSAGLKKDDSAAGTAAIRGWAKQKSFEHWKPDLSASASKAAMLAKDYKAPPLWQPQQSTSGTKAAVLAAKDAGKVEVWKPEATSWGNSAANLALKNDNSRGISPLTDYGYSALGRHGSLMAATGAMSGSRKRSDSTPVPRQTYPDESNATANALSAATHANSLSGKARSDYTAASGATPFVNMPKEMFTSHPPVAPEVEEKRRSDIIHASAVAMAKRMYNMQQRQADQASALHRSEGQAAAISAHSRKFSTPTDESQAMRFDSLQEAAQRLAQERLAKLHDEHVKNRDFRDYYGEYSRLTSRLSLRGRMRRRASSDGTLDEDREQSQKIRAQMSIFSNSLSQVDTKKRQQDREALLAIAQRNVTIRLQGMDEKVFKETGKASPSMLNDWEIKAHAAAQKNSDSRMENYGKIDIGGGRYVDNGVVDAAAARNVQPVLDEINEKAEKERIHQSEVKLEQEAQKRAAENERNREKELKEINRRLKEQDKELEKARKEEEKATKAEHKRAMKENKRKTKEITTVKDPVNEELALTGSDPMAEGASVIPRPPIVEEPKSDAPVVEEPKNEVVTVKEPNLEVTTAPGAYVAPAGMRTSMEMETDKRLEEIISEGEKSPTSSDRKGVKRWFKTKFGRRQSKGNNVDSKDVKDDKVVVADAVLTENGDRSIDQLTSSKEKEKIGLEQSTDNKEVDESMVGERAGRSKRQASSISSVSALSENKEVVRETTKDDEFEEARDRFDENFPLPPSSVFSKPAASPVRDSRFHEEM